LQLFSRIVSAWRHVVDSQDKKIAEFRKPIRQTEKRYIFLKSTAWGKEFQTTASGMGRQKRVMQ